MGQVIVTKQEYRERCRTYVGEGLRPAQVFQRIRKEFPDEKFDLSDKHRIEAVANYYRKKILKKIKSSSKKQLPPLELKPIVSVSIPLLLALRGLDKALEEAVNNNQLAVAKKIIKAKQELC